MTKSTERYSGTRCFICGPDNPAGLQIAFRIEGEFCKGIYTPEETYCGFDGVTHGGIVFSLLDDVMANWFYLQGERALTARSEIRFRKPAAIGTQLSLESSQISRKGRMARMQGRALHPDGHVIAEATATFAIMPHAQ